MAASPINANPSPPRLAATMKKRGAGATKSSAAKASAFSSRPLSSPSSEGYRDRSSKPSSKIPFDFDLAFAAANNAAASSSKKKTRSPSPLLRPSSTSPADPKSVSDLKSLANAEIDSLKRHIDSWHSDVLKDFDASKARISKRFKIQTQACMQLTEDAEKDYKKVSDRISEHTYLIKTSYAEFIAEAQNTASRVCKVSIPELVRSMDKAIEGLRSRYKLLATPTS